MASLANLSRDALLAIGAIVLVMIPAVANAADWVPVTTQADGTKFFIDRSSLYRTTVTARAWVLTDLSGKIETDADRANDAREKELADRELLSCGGRTSTFCPAWTKQGFFNKGTAQFPMFGEKIRRYQLNRLS